MKRVLSVLFCALLGAAASSASGACMTDTSQSDFQAGVSNNVDLNATPGSVVLAKSFAVDQQNTTISINGTPFNTTAWVGQSFIPGLSGRLTRVDLNLFCLFCSGTPPSILVGVRATSGGLPVGSDLAVATIPTISNTGAQAYYSAIFASPATVTAGTQYALVIRPSTNPASGKIGLTRAGTNLVGADVYAGGALLNSPDSGGSWVVQTYNTLDPSTNTADAGFMTYIHGGYAAAGSQTSAILDSNPPAGAMPTWTALSWTASAPTATALRFQAAASDSSGGPFDFVGPDGTAATFFTTSGESLGRFNGSRYLRYRAYLTSDNSTVTPTLSDATVCFTTSSTADLAVTNTDGVTTATTGGVVDYTITVSNNGPGNVTGAAVVDTFPLALTCMWDCAGTGACTASGWGNINDSVNLAAGASVTYVAQCAIASTATGSLVNTATVGPPAGVMDPAPANNAMTDADTLSVSTNVTMSLTDNLEFVHVGDILHYAIDVTNLNGPSDAVVNVLDILPAQLSGGSWTCAGSGSATCGSGSGNTLADSATVPVGGGVEYLYAVTVVAEDASGTISNSASASLQFGTNQPSGNIGAAHSDIVVVFKDSFDSSP